MKRIFVLLIMTVILSGCGLNWQAGISLGVDIVELRKEREAQGKPHIEDILISEDQEQIEE